MDAYHLPAQLKVTPAQVHWFRLRRSGLVEPFSTPEETARRLIGVQAQLPPAAALAFWNRTADCTRSGLEVARLERRSLVRFWGPRNTVHIFRTADWPFLHTAFREERSLAERKFDEDGLLADFRRLVRRTAKRLADGEPLTYKDVKSKKIAEGQDRWVVHYVTFMQLVRDGVACHGPDRGNESSFVHRERWLPDLDWSPPSAEEAFPELAERYLATYGPAELRDLAFWYGGTQTNAKRWVEAAGERCCELDVAGKKLWAVRSDVEELGTDPPTPGRWPVRLLYRFDPLLLATKDKSWLIDEQHYKEVWKGSAHVNATLLVRGRIAGTWRYDRKSKGLHVKVTPFGRLSRPVAKATEQQAEGIAAFFEKPLAGFEIES